MSRTGRFTSLVQTTSENPRWLATLLPRKPVVLLHLSTPTVMSRSSMTSPTRSPASALGFLRPSSWAKYLPVVLGLLVVFSACDSNDDDDEVETPFGLFDTDDDGVIDSDEFGTSFGQLGDFGNFDADASGDLDRDEFNAGVPWRLRRRRQRRHRRGRVRRRERVLRRRPNFRRLRCRRERHARRRRVQRGRRRCRELRQL